MSALAANRVVKLLLVDDHAVVRQGLKLLLETHMGYDVLEAGSASEAVQVVQDVNVDIALIDARMPGHDGIWALREILRIRPDLPALVLSTFDTDDYVRGALDSGARGYLLKDASIWQVREAIDTALGGRGIYLHPAVAQKALVDRRSQDAVRDALSERELEVLQLVANGATNADIAAALYLSGKTVKSHMSSIFRKLGVANRTQAASLAIRQGIVIAQSHAV